VKVRLKVTGSDTAEAYFLEESGAVSPGQAAVFYDLDNYSVFGGGKIATTVAPEVALATTQKQAANLS
jgi:tRNA U34 2-thiouridine synthase MnmA/TrmU